MPPSRRVSLVRIACVVLGLAPLPSRAWYEPGHRIINRLAIDSLPREFPSWVRDPAVASESSFYPRARPLAPDPRSVSSTTMPPIMWSISTRSPGGHRCLHAHSLPVRVCRANPQGPRRPCRTVPRCRSGQRPEPLARIAGFLPWAIAEYYAKLQVQFSYLKTYEGYGTADEIANARANVVYVMGVMGHFVGDGSQPLHTTVHNRGWVGPNPNHYATNDIHALIDGGFIAKAGIALGELEPKVVPAHPLDLAPRHDGRDPIFVDIVDYLLATRATVEPMYQLLRDRKLVDGGPGSREGRAFIEDRLVAAGEMLGSLWLTAWQQAAPDTYLQSTLIQRRTGGG